MSKVDGVVNFVRELNKQFPKQSDDQCDQNDDQEDDKLVSYIKKLIKDFDEWQRQRGVVL